jgi:hypothetical protein
MSLASIESNAADHITGDHSRVEAHPRAGRRLEHGDDSRCREEAAAGILAVDPKLDGVAGRRRVVRCPMGQNVR